MNNDIKRSLAILRSHQRGFVKAAELGGDGQDVPFEQAFSNLAHAYLRDKAPSLLDYEVGFQLLERNQENTKAVGLLGFKIGSQWVYAPVFFLRGDLKGHELLYLKNQDQFVPLKENWINYILNRKPAQLGNGTTRDSRSLGVQQPDLQSMRESPTVKMGSAFPAWVNDALPALAHAATVPREKQAGISLPEFVRQVGVPAVKFLQKIATTYPEIAKKVEEFHGQAMLDAITFVEKQARSNSVLSAPLPKRSVITGSVLTKLAADENPTVNGKLKIITQDLTQVTPPKDETITEEDREKLLRDGVLVKDERKGEEVSVAYKITTEQKLTNPHESGLYEVLTKPGTFERCYVLIGPVGPTGSEPFAVVFRTDGGKGKSWMNTHPSNIWVGSKIEGKEYDSWYNGLSDAGKLSKSRSKYVLLGPDGRGTCVFEVRNTIDAGDGQYYYDVHFDRHAASRSSTLPSLQIRDYYDRDRDMGYRAYEDGERIHVNGKKGSNIRCTRGDVFVPEGFKAITVRAETAQEKTRREKYEAEWDGPGDCGGESDPPPLQPGNLVDIELQIMKKTAALTIYHNGTEAEINRNRMTPKAAFVHLIRDHGLNEKQARELLKEAQARRKTTCRIKYASWVKQAFGGLMGPLGQGPGAPALPEPQYGADGMMGSGVPTQHMMEEEVPVDGMEYGQRGESMMAEPDYGAMQQVEQAAQTGQREVFDTAMVGSMLKRVRDDSMVDKYLGDLMKGLDRVGRIMFMFYWHQDDFADRYGKEDLPELEDSLRNTFESIGDLTIFLKQKTITPFPSEGGIGVDLADISGS